MAYKKKDETNSILIDISESVSIESIKKKIQTISSIKQGEITTSFYKDALKEGMPDSIIMDFAFIFGWDIDFIFDVRKGDKFAVIFEADYSEGEKISSGDIIFAEFINKNDRYIAQRFFDKNQGKMSTIFTFCSKNAWYEKGKKNKNFTVAHNFDENSTNQHNFGQSIG